MQEKTQFPLVVVCAKAGSTWQNTKFEFNEVNSAKLLSQEMKASEIMLQPVK
jgi:hypothetical protein